MNRLVLVWVRGAFSGNGVKILCGYRTLGVALDVRRIS